MTARRVAVIGANGQLGCDLARAWAAQRPADEFVGLTHADIEVTDPGSVRRALEAASPTIVVNTAAFHKVDAAEDDPSRAFTVNAAGTLHVARACRALGATLVHVSTDYVFSGVKCRPYVEEDAVDPVNVYGASKAAGEMLVRYTWPRHFIVRSSGLYGVAGASGKGGNFVELMLRLAREGKPIRVVDDQTLTPTSTRALAVQIGRLLETEAFGTYHATCQGECTWFGFAAEIFRLAGLTPALGPQTTAESGARATRPSHSVLENTGLKALGLDTLPDWHEALADYLAEKGALRA